MDLFWINNLLLIEQKTNNYLSFKIIIPKNSTLIIKKKYKLKKYFKINQLKNVIKKVLLVAYRFFLLSKKLDMKKFLKNNHLLIIISRGKIFP